MSPPREPPSPRSRQTDDQPDTTTTNPAGPPAGGVHLATEPSSPTVTPPSSPDAAGNTAFVVPCSSLAVARHQTDVPTDPDNFPRAVGRTSPSLEPPSRPHVREAVVTPPGDPDSADAATSTGSCRLSSWSASKTARSALGCAARPLGLADLRVRVAAGCHGCYKILMVTKATNGAWINRIRGEVGTDDVAASPTGALAVRRAFSQGTVTGTFDDGPAGHAAVRFPFATTSVPNCGC